MGALRLFPCTLSIESAASVRLCTKFQLEKNLDLSKKL